MNVIKVLALAARGSEHVVKIIASVAIVKGISDWWRASKRRDK